MRILKAGREPESMSEWWTQGGAPQGDADADARKAAKARKQPGPGPVGVGRLVVPALMVLGGVAGLVVGLLPSFRRWAWENYIELPALVALFVTSALAIAAGIGLSQRRLRPEERRRPDEGPRAGTSSRHAPGTRKYNLGGQEVEP